MESKRIRDIEKSDQVPSPCAVCDSVAPCLHDLPQADDEFRLCTGCGTT